ncbi:MAG: hypothetical protein ABDH28_06590 [Brevinematia bacterium]
MLDKITKNFTIKVISLLIAIGLWFYLKNLVTTSYEFYIPLNYTSLPPNKVIINQNTLPNYVLVKLRGNKEKISKVLEIPKASIHAFLDLSKPNDKNIYKVNITLPEEMKRLEIHVYPNEVFVDIDEIVETNLLVVVKNSADYIVTPSTVKVRTVSRNLEKLSSIEIEVDTTKSVDRVFLENTSFLVFFPQVLTVSNTNYKR